MESKSISRQLANYIYNLSLQDLPNEVVDRAKSLVLDALATAVAGRELQYPKMAFRMIEQNRGNATVFTYKAKVPPMDAALVNGVMVSSIGQDDMMYRFHPGAVVIPAVFAASEEKNSTGSELLCAIVAGYDVMGRIFLAAPHIVPRFRGVSVFGPIAAAAASGKLLGLNEDQLVSALGYAANLSSGVAQCWIAGTMEGKFQNGFASRNGLMASILAGNGAIAAEDTFEGKAGFYQAFAGSAPDINKITGSLGSVFLIMDAECKPFPVCALEQVPINLSQSLVEMNGISGKPIENVTVFMPEEELSYPGTNNSGPFLSRFHAIMSSQFCVAAALLGKPVKSYTYFDNCFADPEVVELAKKVELIGKKEENTIKIEVVLQDGNRYNIEGDKEDLLIPYWKSCRTKFENLAIDYLGSEKVDRVINVVSNLDSIEDVGVLTQILNLS